MNYQGFTQRNIGAKAQSSSKLICAFAPFIAIKKIIKSYLPRPQA